QTFTAEPGVEAAPAGKDQGDTARRASAGMHAGHPLAHMVAADVAQADTLGLRKHAQAIHVAGVQDQRAWGQAFVDTQVLQVGAGQRLVVIPVILHRCHASGRREHQAGNSRDSDALVSSPMRSRNSVPMLATKRPGSSEASTSSPKAGASACARSGIKASDWAACGWTSHWAASSPGLAPQ